MTNEIANGRPLTDFFMRCWTTLHQPRNVTMVVSIGWFVLFVTGIFALLYPPVTVTITIGRFMVTILGISLIVGGLIGLIGCVPGWWWVERSGIAAVITGSSAYLGVILFLQFTGSGNRLVQAGFVVFAIVQLIKRWLSIEGAQMDPKKGLLPHDD